MAKRIGVPTVVVGVVCASLTASAQVLAGFEFPLWLQLVFLLVTTGTAGVAWVASLSAASSKKLDCMIERLLSVMPSDGQQPLQKNL